MTDQTTAAQAHEIRFSDDQLMAIATAAWEVHSDEAYSPDGLLMACVAVQAALLSKLRAPVANTDELSLEAQEHGNRRYEQGFAAGWGQCVASAPVADERATMFWDARFPDEIHDTLADAMYAAQGNHGLLQGDTVEIQQAVRLPALHIRVTDGDDEGDNFKYAIIEGDAAPQASEAVRDAGVAASEDVTLPTLPPINHKFASIITPSFAEALQNWARTYTRTAILADRQERGRDTVPIPLSRKVMLTPADANLRHIGYVFGKPIFSRVTEPGAASSSQPEQS